MSRVIDNFTAVKEAVSAACVAASRDESQVQLLTVSKTIPIHVIQELYEYGVREFAENREPELAMKKAAMPDDIIWHFIGPVQSNKIRKVVKLADVIHSIESLPQLERFERIAGEEGRSLKIFLEVNVSGEQSKGGMTPEELPEIALAASKCVNLDFTGLMTMAPFEADEKELADIFSTLRKLKKDTEKSLGREIPHLSMGMSGDFRTAVACGSTVVRVGTAIFSKK